jgi:serpin B
MVKIMNWKKCLFLSTFILLIIPQGSIPWTQVQAEPQEQEHIMGEDKIMSSESLFTEGNGQFAFNLFREIFTQSEQENIFISPSSVSMALAMLYNGANGETQEQMQIALGLKDLTIDEINRDNNLLRESLLNADPEVQLAIANSIWMREGLSFKPEFITTNEQFYHTEAKTLDFNNSKSLDIINNWVKDNTKDKIDQIIDEISAEDIMFLINAIYFKGDWTDQFDPNKTSQKRFYLKENETKTVSMMSRFGSYKYTENDDFQLVSLPYGKEKRLSMYIFLPKENNNLATFTEKLTFENWSNLMGNLNYKEGTVKMPRFKLDYELELNQALKQLGMNVIFDSQKADFSNLSENPVYIDKVKHKTYLEVNEEGTEAAAVTSIGIRATSVNLNEPFMMTIDRPFFCLIQDEKTGAILFMGAIYNPES